MTNVLINGLFLTQRRTAVQRYAYETLRALDEVLSAYGATTDMSFAVAAPCSAKAPKLRSIQFEPIGSGNGWYWEQITLPLHARGRLLLSFCPTGPLLYRHQIVTVHDAAVFTVPQAFGPLFRTWRRWLMTMLARRTPCTMAVSNCAKWDLVRHCGADAEKVLVSGEGWEHVQRVGSDRAVLGRHGLRKHGYVLAVGDLSPHRNFDVITRASHLLHDHGVQVAAVGTIDRRVYTRLDPEEFPALRLLGEVNDRELRALYENAAAFVYPSQHEGFDITSLQAMAFDCPVIASRAAANQEVCGDAALYFHPKDARGLAALIARVIQDRDARSAMVARGKARLRQRSWKGAALKHLAALRLQCDGVSATPEEQPPRQVRAAV